MNQQEELERKYFKEFYLARLEEHLDKYRKTYETKKEASLQKDFRVKETVWYKSINTGADKLSPKWLVRGKIVQKGFDSYRIKLEDGRIVIANKKHVKGFLKRGECWEQSSIN
ncbi:hypothetical protein NGRA_0863 [Nosema granulosis]|uniref:Uncharacterized protein n=1 Tax=Nosema granulosis TaxID=83296 RepID=A0A9P6GZI7_9MICR|nr:hypothetical protein NGRA_0863 [Nosema granulosis]